MLKFKRLIVKISPFLLVAMVFMPANAHALNGARVIGNSPRDIALGGATTASPYDTSVMVKNPAGLTKIGNRFDINLGAFLPRATLQPKGALGNNGVSEKSNIHIVPIGNVGISLQTKDTSLPMAFGVGIFSMAGVASKFNDSRINPALDSNAYDRRMEIKHLRMTPTVAVDLNEKVSVGATVNIGMTAFRTDLPVASKGYVENRGQGDYDYAFGAGYTLGILYKVNEKLNLGIAYESETWMNDFRMYDEVFKRLDMAPVLSAGLSYSFTDTLRMSYDMRYIFWTRSKMTHDLPSEGGFGWKDQLVNAIGLEYDISENVTLRIGYNYAKSPVRNEFVFANGLAPLITEHHLTLGVSMKLSDNWDLDFTWSHAFKKKMTDNGKGDAYSQNGANTSVSAAGELLMLGLGYKF